MKIARLAIVIYLVLFSIVGVVVCTPTVNYWLVYAGKDPVFMWYHGMMVGLVPGLGQVVILVGVATFIASFFL